MADVRPTIMCSRCGKLARRVFSAPAIHFKGKGFYNTDYKKGKKQEPKEEKPPQEVKKDADKKEKNETTT